MFQSNQCLYHNTVQTSSQIDQKWPKIQPVGPQNFGVPPPTPNLALRGSLIYQLVPVILKLNKNPEDGIQTVPS